MTPQITTHYFDGRPSETRDMTLEEIAQIPTESLFPADPDGLGLDDGN
jgi:hypothetical protein